MPLSHHLNKPFADGIVLKCKNVIQVKSEIRMCQYQHVSIILFSNLRNQAPVSNLHIDNSVWRLQCSEWIMAEMEFCLFLEMSLHVAQADLKLTVLTKVRRVVCTTNKIFEMLESHFWCLGYNAKSWTQSVSPSQVQPLPRLAHPKEFKLNAELPLFSRIWDFEVCM